jgi:hypothetical protein
MLKFTFMLIKLWLNISSCVNGGAVFLENYRCSEITSGSWDAPDYPVLPCSNSAMKGNNGTNRKLYHDTTAQTIT